MWLCQEGGLADGEHYIIAAPLGVIEDAVEHGVCIQAECWVFICNATYSQVDKVRLFSFQRDAEVQKGFHVFLSGPGRRSLARSLPEGPRVGHLLSGQHRHICMFTHA